MAVTLSLSGIRAGIPIFLCQAPSWLNRGASVTGRKPFDIFVTDSAFNAVRQAKKAAGDKNVDVIGASITQQCLKAGLLDEIQIDLAPFLLGGGVRLFDPLDSGPIELEKLAVVEGVGVTHLRYRVVK